MTGFSDYIVYADESGSASLDGQADPDYPVFVLSMILVKKAEYAQQIVPAMGKLKFDAVGHDQLILHEREIRRQKGDFAFLQVSHEVRTEFMAAIDDLVENAPLELFAAVINKPRLAEKYVSPMSPYSIALGFLMERILSLMLSRDQTGKLLHVCFECRGKKEDQELELAFRRIAANQLNWGYKNPDFTQMRWEPKFVDKKSNSSGLQLADLTARPIGIRSLRPKQPNRAYDIIAKKFGYDGLKFFP